VKFPEAAEYRETVAKLKAEGYTDARTMRPPLALAQGARSGR
jgi:hypothetical protein